ncbi:hypothetical protein [Rhizobium sp. L1K21]|uniref:hypothetical protein n=1 Tax=Rhizobium sp. L1K21 TaxID=2954933 RepID=UPI00209250EF|nr:hypothetical protein [Rhizobium sp. L1K21]MCO6185441.1 hypothetical protein [Rhizobium sp. L1K21]
MSISPELMMAILSMDSYNRGYNAGIEDEVLDGAGTADGLGEAGIIGNARILARPNNIDVADWKGAGFYAVAYAWNGQTIISYRGTDNPTLELSRTNDILSGWTTGAGYMGSGTQAEYAFAFR